MPMDIRASVSIVPPSGSHPTRPKSLRQQRASNGANIIKAYVLESEQRREQAKFHATSSRSKALDDDRYEHEHITTLSPRTVNRNQTAAPDAHALDALFAERRMHRSRRPSISMAPARPGSPTPAVHEVHSSTTAIKPIMRKRLQMEMLHSSSAANAKGLKDTPSSRHVHRSTPSTLVPHHPRVKHNLGAKLDALIKSSPWNRRRVVVNNEDRTHRTAAKVGSPRHAHHNTGHSLESTTTNSHNTNKEPTETEIEMKVMAAFRQMVRLWRERKRKAEAQAVSIMNGNSNGLATGTGRNGSKFRKDLMAQSGNVVGILSRRLIGEVPALKFFDDEVDPATNPPNPTASMTSPAVKTSGLPSSAIATAKPERARPRGVCYTLDAFGCRKIKMQSSTTTANAASAQQRNASNRPQNHKSEALTLEKAMSRSLRRKMARRLKTRRQSIMRLSDDFSKSRRDLAMKLRTQLALQRAEIEKMFSKRLTLLMTDDTSLPPYMARKELHLARLRCKKANLLEKCETLRVLGLTLQKVEAAGEASGVEVTTGELHFLDLFRCVVEENQVLTPIISNAIRQHMRAQDLKQPMIGELFQLLDSERRGENTTGP